MGKQRKIAGPMRIESGALGAEAKYVLQAGTGGSSCKVAQYQIKVIRYQGGTNPQIALELAHGPDGEAFAPLTTPIAYTSLTAIPQVLSGASGTPDTNAAHVMGEWLQPIVFIKDASGASVVWALVEIYEIRKEF